jgi:hypothetical protein
MRELKFHLIVSGGRFRDRAMQMFSTIKEKKDVCPL